MNILSDAEYRQLPESGKTAYWRARYEEAEDKADRYRTEARKLHSALNRIREYADRRLELPQ